MAVIERVLAREVLDSRGNPTVECEVHLKGFAVGTAMVPSGASTGKYEAVELRDGGKRYHGAGVRTAVDNVGIKISKAIRKKTFKSQEELDNALLKLDGTSDKSNLGSNALLSVSLAFARANAFWHKRPLSNYINDILPKKKMCLPVPYSNLINGGKHAGTKLKIQEFMVVPHGAKSFAEATQMTVETYHSLKKKIVKKYGVNAANVGDEGGFAPPIDTAEQALDLLEQTIESLGYSGRLSLAIDSAASEFHKNGKYFLGKKGISPSELMDYYAKLANDYDIISFEDPFEEDDYDSFAELTKKVGHKVQIVGDDLLTTNPKRVEKAIASKACNALLVKPNQIGTVTETLKVVKLAKDGGWKIVVSHRSGETNDAFIADFAVGIGADYAKFGAPSRGERVAKYNRLSSIENELTRAK